MPESVHRRSQAPGQADWAFLAELHEVLDWRIVVVVDTLRRGGLLDELPFRLGEACSRLDIDAGAAHRLFRILEHARIVTLDGEVVSKGSAFPNELQLRQSGQHANAIRQWSGQLDDRLRGAVPADGGIRFDRDAWLQSMAAGASRDADGIAGKVLAEHPGARTLLDLGGGHGEYGRAFARRGLKVTMLDTPEIIDLVRDRGWLADDGIDLIAGDFHRDLPGGPYDIVLCFGITHTFGAEKNAEFFQRVAGVIGPDGLVAISTFLGGTGQRADLFAIHMLANRSGGNAHSEASYRQWLLDAGLELTQLQPLRDEGRALMLAVRSDGATTAIENPGKPS